MNSSFGKLNWLDIGKGFLLAIITALIAGIYQAIQGGEIAFTWIFFKPMVFSAIGAGLAYLIKNIFTNSDGTPLAPEKK